jgi:hypothetical protein
MAAGDDYLKRHDELKRLRSPEEGKWREIAQLIRPDDTILDMRSTQERRDENVFDAAPIYALDDFAAGIFGQATNPTNRWFELTIGDKDLAEYGPVKAWLWTAAGTILASLSPAVSNFYAAAPAWFADLGAFGIGSIAQEERVGEGRISDRGVPLGQTFIDQDADGELNTFHNEIPPLRGSQVKPFIASLGGTLPPTVRDDSSYLLVHCVSKNRDAVPGRLGPQYMPWRACYVSPDIKELHLEGGYVENPYHPIFWQRKTGRLYPGGPGATVRPDVNMLNEMERSHIVAAQFAAEPPLLLHNEDVLSAGDLVPNATLYGAMSEKGEARAAWLERRGQLQLSTSMSQQRRDAIRTAFRFGLMQLLKDRPQMTATEFLGFQQQSLELMGPNLISIQIGLAAFIARRFGILDRAGQIPPRPPELQARALGIEYVSPLAKAQQIAEGRGVLQLQQSIEQMALTDPRARDHFDVDVAVPIIGKSFTSVPGVIRDQKAIEELRQARAAATQPDVELDRAAKGVTIAAEAAHAAQAATLAGGRRQ